ncbi:MAG: Rrf2 family transcriptional regulator [Streptosporangiales bacterium]|nr:Rrf2 family transcriptional regulator [Streptosporangiales bacterium]
MHISARVDYAMRALVVLASSENERLSCEALAEAQQIPARFLEGILNQLRRAGIVVSRRGNEGGYLLGRPAREIMVADVIRALDGPLAEVRGMRPEQSEYKGPVEPLKTVWVAARASLRGVLDHVSVADIATGRLPKKVERLANSPEAWAVR